MSQQETTSITLPETFFFLNAMMHHNTAKCIAICGKVVGHHLFAYVTTFYINVRTYILYFCKLVENFGFPWLWILHKQIKTNLGSVTNCVPHNFKASNFLCFVILFRHFSNKMGKHFCYCGAIHIIYSPREILEFIFSHNFMKRISVTVYHNL